MRAYEDYNTARAKRAAQRASVPLKRMQPTGKARGYLFVMDENGRNSKGEYDAVAGVTAFEDGNTDPRGNLAGTGVSHEYLRTCCRRIGAKYLPPKWKERYDYYKTPE